MASVVASQSAAAATHTAASTRQAKDANGLTEVDRQLHAAALDRNVDKVRAALDKGARVNSLYDSYCSGKATTALCKVMEKQAAPSRAREPLRFSEDGTYDPDGYLTEEDFNLNADSHPGAKGIWDPEFEEYCERVCRGIRKEESFAKDMGNRVIRMLVAAGADISLGTKKSWAKLHQAAYASDVAQLKKLNFVRSNSTIATTSLAEGGWSLLHLAAIAGHVAVVEYLVVARKVAVDAVDGTGCTPLYWACVLDHPGVVEQLLAAKANRMVCSKLGMKAVHAAAQGGSPDTLKAVLAGYTANKKRRTVNTKTHSHKSPLYFAASWGNDAVIPALLAAGASVNVVNHNLAPLNQAVVHRHTAAALACLEAGAKVAPFDDAGKNALHNAAETGQVELVRALLHAGADASAATKPQDGSRLYMYHSRQKQAPADAVLLAVRNGHAEVAALLLAAGAEPDGPEPPVMAWSLYDSWSQPRPTNCSPMHEAARRGSVAMMRQLAAAGATLQPKTMKASSTSNDAECDDRDGDMVPMDWHHLVTSFNHAVGKRESQQRHAWRNHPGYPGFGPLSWVDAVFAHHDAATLVPQLAGLRLLTDITVLQVTIRNPQVLCSLLRWLPCLQVLIIDEIDSRMSAPLANTLDDVHLPLLDLLFVGYKWPGKTSPKLEPIQTLAARRRSQARRWHARAGLLERRAFRRDVRMMQPVQV